ncbi:hypothetical protein QBC39DRAFT_335403 [Podospora conica]|nr:hypothetical protein QBC39DRAFT_335403 [Schizothecium conicum]
MALRGGRRTDGLGGGAMAVKGHGGLVCRRGADGERRAMGAGVDTTTGTGMESSSRCLRMTTAAGWSSTGHASPLARLALEVKISFNAVSDLLGGAGIPESLDSGLDEETARWIASAKFADWHQLQMAPFFWPPRTLDAQWPSPVDSGGGPIEFGDAAQQEGEKGGSHARLEAVWRRLFLVGDQCILAPCPAEMMTPRGVWQLWLAWQLGSRDATERRPPATGHRRR